METTSLSPATRNLPSFDVSGTFQITRGPFAILSAVGDVFSAGSQVASWRTGVAQWHEFPDRDFSAYIINVRGRACVKSSVAPISASVSGVFTSTSDVNTPQTANFSESLLSVAVTERCLMGFRLTNEATPTTPAINVPARYTNKRLDLPDIMAYSNGNGDFDPNFLTSPLVLTRQITQLDKIGMLGASMNASAMLANEGGLTSYIRQTQAASNPRYALLTFPGSTDQVAIYLGNAWLANNLSGGKYARLKSSFWIGNGTSTNQTSWNATTFFPNELSGYFMLWSPKYVFLIGPLVWLKTDDVFLGFDGVGASAWVPSVKFDLDLICDLNLLLFDGSDGPTGGAITTGFMFDAQATANANSPTVIPAQLMIRDDLSILTDIYADQIAQSYGISGVKF